MNSRGQINDSSIALGLLVYLALLSVIFTAVGNDFNQNPQLITADVVFAGGYSEDSIGALNMIETFLNYLTLAVGTPLPLVINFIFLFIPKVILAFIVTKNLIPFLGGG